MKYRFFILLGSALLLCVPTTGFAQSVPDAGLAAESAGRWEDAVRVYRDVLQREPQRADLWVRMADIEARRGDLAASIAALEQATRLLPADAPLHERLSQAYALSNNPVAALAAIEVALVLQPNNPEYLLASGTLATWHGDYHRAQQQYSRLSQLRPDDMDLALRLARVSAWAGETDESVAAYRRYLKAQPDAAEVWLELAKTESWRGNYGAALDVLHTYVTQFGETADSARELAAILARSGRPTEAVNLLEPLLQQDPTGYELNLIRTIALAMQRRPREAFDALESVRRLDRVSRETQSAERMVRAILGSTMDSAFSAYSDSDRLQVQRFAPSAALSLASGTHVSVGYERDFLQARRGDLQQLNGADTARFEHGWAGLAQKIGRITLDGRIGHATAEHHQLTTYRVSTQIDAFDVLKLSLERSSGFFVISPRTVGVGLTQLQHGIDLDWAPTVHYHVMLDGSYQRLSDGNRRWEVTVTPRRTVARTQRLNLDLGFSAYQLGTTRDLSNGYYDPRRYESYAAVAYPYFKVSENIGLGLSLTAGAQRDDMSPTFRFGGTATSEATVGIYRAWVLKISGSATINRRLESGAFRGYNGAATLTRRF